MAQSKILVDTNAYLRLAKTIRPLLFMPFGENEYCLYILPELNEELKSHKLQKLGNRRRIRTKSATLSKHWSETKESHQPNL